MQVEYIDLSARQFNDCKFVSLRFNNIQLEYVLVF